MTMHWMQYIKILKAIRDDSGNASISHPTCIAICVWVITWVAFLCHVNILKAIRDCSDSVSDSPSTCIAICVWVLTWVILHYNGQHCWRFTESILIFLRRCSDYSDNLKFIHPVGEYRVCHRTLWNNKMCRVVADIGGVKFYLLVRSD